MCLFDWLAQSTIAPLSATGHPMLNHSLPPPTLLCPFPSRFFNFPFSFNLPVLFPLFFSLSLLSLASSLDLKVGTRPINTTAGSPNRGGGGGEPKERDRKREGSHHYTLTYIHFLPADWILRWSLRPITSGGGVPASQWHGPLLAERLHCLHTVFSNHTVAERVIGAGRVSLTDENHQKWVNGIKKAEEIVEGEKRKEWREIAEDTWVFLA